MKDCLELKDVNINYLKNYFALLNINLKFQFNYNYLIIGESESGKSTLVRLLAGLEKKYKGNLVLNDEVVTVESDFFKNEIGFIFGNGV
ncbi:MAG: ATP-binding cassette domain-containing protein, partial [Christensenellales bacterium]